MPRKNGLTKKEKAFCEAYVFDSESATGAYMKAYDCSYKTANTQGWKVLRKPLIQEYINKLQQENHKAYIVKFEELKQDIKKNRYRSAPSNDTWGFLVPVSAVEKYSSCYCMEV